MTAQGTLRRGQAHRAVWTRGQYEQGAKGRPPQAGRASVARALRSDLSRSAEGAVGAKQSPGRHHRACGPSVEGSGGLTGRMVRGQPAARELVPVVLEEWQSAAVLSRVPVAAPARRFAGRRVGALTPASAGYGKFSRHQRGSGTVLSKQAGRKLVFGRLVRVRTHRGDPEPTLYIVAEPEAERAIDIVKVALARSYHDYEDLGTDALLGALSLRPGTFTQT